LTTISELDRLERALIDLEYATADFKLPDGSKADDLEFAKLRAQLQMLIAFNRSAQRSVKSLRGVSIAAKRKSDPTAPCERTATPPLPTRQTYALRPPILEGRLRH
jgi:hypothetical protein